MTNIQEEARKIVLDNLATDEERPWEGYYPSMIKQLERRANCTTEAATCAIQQACEPEFLTLGQLANRILDRDDVIKDLLGLLDDLCGPDAARNETYKRGMELLNHEVN